jgi:hypothetical protein
MDAGQQQDQAAPMADDPSGGVEEQEAQPTKAAAIARPRAAPGA